MNAVSSLLRYLVSLLLKAHQTHHGPKNGGLQMTWLGCFLPTPMWWVGSAFSQVQRAAQEGNREALP